MSWTLWLIGLFLAVMLIAAGVWLSVYPRWRAITYIRSQGGACSLNPDKNEWVTNLLGDWGLGFREVSRIDFNCITDEVLMHASVLHEADTLWCQSFPASHTFGPRGAEALRTMTNVRLAGFCGDAFSDEMLASLVDACPNVTDFTSLVTYSRRGALEAICRSESIQNLCLGSPLLIDEDFRGLDPLVPVRCALFSGPEVGDHTAIWLSQSDRLETLALIDTSITDAGVEALAELPNLSTLNLQGCRDVTAAGVSRLASSPSLTTLHLPSEAITAESVAALRTSLTLTRVHITGGAGDPELQSLIAPNASGTGPGFEIKP